MASSLASKVLASISVPLSTVTWPGPPQLSWPFWRPHARVLDMPPLSQGRHTTRQTGGARGRMHWQLAQPP